MAAYREHISVSGLLGLGYGLTATLAFDYLPVQGMLAGCLTAVGGMIPDLDSDRGRPVRELFGVVGAVAPLLLVNPFSRFLGGQPDPEVVMLFIVVMYLLIKYGGASLVSRLSVHRGMFHSIPALGIAAELVYLSYPNPLVRVKLLMAGGMAIGILSHLLLDELYSIQIKNMRIRLKKSAGTALKMVGERFIPNVFTYSLWATLSYAVLLDAGWLEQNVPRTSAGELSSTREQAEGEDPLSEDYQLGAPDSAWPSEALVPVETNRQDITVESLESGTISR